MGTRRTSTEALAQITASQSHFGRRQIVQAAAECSQGRGLGAEVVLRLSQDLLQSPELVRLGEHRLKAHNTTREILALEKSVLATAEAMQERRHFLPTHWTEEATARHSRLTGEQTDALRHLCAARGGFPRLPCSGQRPPGNTHAAFQNLEKGHLRSADAGVKPPPVNMAQNQFSVNREASISKFLSVNIKNPFKIRQPISARERPKHEQF